MLKKNKFTFLIILIILYLSFASSKSLAQTGLLTVPYIDKIGHVAMYFGLMAVIILEHRNSLNDTRRLLLIALIPLILGVAVEFLQPLLTRDRSRDFFDGVADFAGIAIAIFAWLLIRPYKV